MKEKSELVATDDISPLIRSIRETRVILDVDLAKLYGVETRALNQALKRNHQRFPEDFVFEQSREEILGISQNVISLQKLKFFKSVALREYLPEASAAARTTAPATPATQ